MTHTRRDHKITLPDDLWEFAKSLGNGNASAGIASLLSIERYGMPQTETTEHDWRQPPSATLVKALRHSLTYDGFEGRLLGKNPPPDFWQPIYIDHAIVTLERTTKDARRERVQLRTPEVILALLFGRWPTAPVTHVDGNTTNNHLDNLGGGYQ